MIYDDEETIIYSQLCQGKLQPAPSKLRELRCRYVTNNEPYLLIGPFKLEEVHKDPKIVLYHDAMYDREIDVLKRMAYPRFKRAQLRNAATGQLETVDHCISKSAWLNKEEHSVVSRIFQRTKDMTGLDVMSAEDLKVLNYGIAGYYLPHFDYPDVREISTVRQIGDVTYFVGLLSICRILRCLLSMRVEVIALPRYYST